MTDGTPLERTTWRPKVCDVCGDVTPLEALGHRRYEWPTRHARFEMLLDDVLCARCGFVFAGRVPEEAFLEAFYRDGFSTESPDAVIEPDFDGERRLARLGRHLGRGASVLELGAGGGEFVERLLAAGYRAAGLDPLATPASASVAAGFVRRGLRADAQYDAVAAYDVLEHVGDPRAWLAAAAAWLGPSGRLVLEVPDFARAPQFSLNYQHLLHFTEEHLTALLTGCGFTTIELDPTGASRSYGLVVVAERTSSPLAAVAADPALVRRGRALYQRAEGERARAAARYAVMLDEVAAHVARRPRGTAPQVLFWGANDIASAVAELVPAGLREHCLLVDNSAQKVGARHPGFARPIVGPRFRRDPGFYRVFVVCALAWSHDIRRQIEAMELGEHVVIDATAWLSPETPAAASAPVGER